MGERVSEFVAKNNCLTRESSIDVIPRKKGTSRSYLFRDIFIPMLPLIIEQSFEHHWYDILIPVFCVKKISDFSLSLFLYPSFCVCIYVCICISIQSNLYPRTCLSIHSSSNFSLSLSLSLSHPLPLACTSTGFYHYHSPLAENGAQI